MQRYTYYISTWKHTSGIDLIHTSVDSHTVCWEMCGYEDMFPHADLHSAIQRQKLPSSGRGHPQTYTSKLEVLRFFARQKISTFIYYLYMYFVHASSMNRSNHLKRIGSHPNSEIKPGWAWVVRSWGTRLEGQVMIHFFVPFY